MAYLEKNLVTFRFETNSGMLNNLQMKQSVINETHNTYVMFVQNDELIQRLHVSYSVVFED